MADNRLSRIRDRLRQEGFSSAVFELFVQKYKWPSDDRGTLKTYQDVWSKFVTFCQNDPEQALQFKREDVTNFAARLFTEGASGDAVSAAITALDSTRAVFLPLVPPLSQDTLIASIRKSAKIHRAAPRIALPPTFYDPFVIFRSLARICKHGEKSKLHLLRAKVETLLLLDGGMRGNELVKIFTENIKLYPKKAEVKIPWLKEKKRKEWSIVNIYCSCVAKKLDKVNSGLEAKDLDDVAETDTPLWRRFACALCFFRAYLLHPTVVKRRRNCSPVRYECLEGKRWGTPYLVTHKSKAKAIALVSIRKEIAGRLRKAGLDPVWSVHSIRGAGVSKLYNLGVCIDRCMEYGRWSNKETIEKHYLKRTSYPQFAILNNSLPLWEVLRIETTLVNE